MPVTQRDFTVTIDTRNLQVTHEYLKQLPAVLHNVVLMKTINRTGAMMTTEVTRGLAQMSGARRRQAMQAVSISRATPRNLTYALTIDGEWVTGLVYIITQQDERVCPICIAAEQGGPYTQEQVSAMRHAYPHLHGLIHPGCRCYTIPAQQNIQQALSGQGDLAERANRVVADNAPRILNEEYQFAVKKLRADLGMPA